MAIKVCGYHGKPYCSVCNACEDCMGKKCKHLKEDN